jgi:hypothetical protein
MSSSATSYATALNTARKPQRARKAAAARRLKSRAVSPASLGLLEEFPDVVDGFERSGMVYAKMGNHTLAADFHRKALDFVTHPSRRDDYDDIDFYREQVEKEERLAGLR